MSRILLAWELGGNLGHLSKLLLVARRLRRRGHEILFSVQDVGTGQQLLTEEGFRYVQCPRASRWGAGCREPASFSHILAQAGFADPGVLTGLISAWHGLFELFQPEVVLSQYAPTAHIAARIYGVPCLELAIGFEHPPDVAPFPCFRPWLQLSADELMKTEQVILDNINGICVRRGVPAHQNLQQALKCDRTLFATFPELDHYQGRTDGRYTGPLFITDDGVDMEWPQDGFQRIFVYLKPDRWLPLVMQELDRSGASVVAFIPGIDGTMLPSYSSGRIRISSAKVKLSCLLPGMDLAVTHANHGTIAAVLLAGKPLLSIPTTIEQLMLSSCLESHGVGVGVARRGLSKAFAPALDRLLTDRSFRKAAVRFAERYAGYDRETVLNRLSLTIERLPQWVAGRGNRSKQSTETEIMQ